MSKYLIDYAMPLMRIERAAKKIHDACLEHDYEQAQEQTLLLLTEARMLQTTLIHMKEKACPTPSPTASE